MGGAVRESVRKVEKVFLIMVLALTMVYSAAGHKARAEAVNLEPQFKSAWGLGEAGLPANSIRSLVVNPRDGYNEYFAIADVGAGGSLGLSFAPDKGTANPAYIIKLSDEGGNLHRVWAKAIYATEMPEELNYMGMDVSPYSKNYRINLNSLTLLNDGSLIAVGMGVPNENDDFGDMMRYKITLKDSAGTSKVLQHYINKFASDYTDSGVPADGLVVKMDAEGNLSSATAIGTAITASISGDIELGRVQATSDGGYIVIGYSRSSDGMLGPMGSKMEPFIVKYTRTGARQWLTHFYDKDNNVTNKTTELLSVAELPGGGYAVSGWSSAQSFTKVYKNGSPLKDAEEYNIAFPLNNDNSQHKGLIGILSADGTLQKMTTYAPVPAADANLNDIAVTTDGASILAVGSATVNSVSSAFSVKFKTDDLSVEAEKSYSQPTDVSVLGSSAENPDSLTTIVPAEGGGYWLGGTANGLPSSSSGTVPNGGAAKGGQDMLVLKSDGNLNTEWAYLAGGTRNEAPLQGSGYGGTLAVPMLEAAGNGFVLYGASQSSDGELAALASASPVSGADGGYNAFVARYDLIDPDQTAADAAAQIIAALPGTDALTLADKAAVAAARQAYDSLTAQQQALLSAETLDKLTAAIAAIAALEEAQAEADRESAWQATYQINNLPDPLTLADKAAVTAARQAYDSLTDAQKALVSADTVEKLAAAEVTIAVLEAGAEQEAWDHAAAQAVADKINALPDPVALADKAEVAAARQMYDSLTEVQQALVPAGVLDKLKAAEETIAALEAAAQQAAADQAAAKAIADKINALPDPVALADKAAVAAARQMYDSLTDAQKALVPAGVLDKLKAAEKAIAALEGAASTPSAPFNPSPPSGTAPAAVPSSSSVAPVESSSGSASVPPAAGGRIGLGDAAVVDIPANALNGSESLSVKIQQVTAPPAAPAELVPAGTVYEFSAGDAASYTFAKPVTLTLTFDPAKIPAGYAPAIYHYDEAAGAWTRIGGTVSGSTVKAEVTHFTKFAVFAEKTAVAEQPAAVSLKDIEGHWAAAYIEELAARGITGGYPDGTFRPNRTITRAEYASMLVKALDLKATGSSQFGDMNHHWAAEAVLAAADHGIVSGYGGGQFRPDQSITRQEMVVMAVRAFGFTGGTPLAFADSGSIAAWAQSSVAAAVQAGIVSGQPGNRFDPLHTATRAEAAAVLVKALKLK
ncbi:S-layer homology domain-containing protein [Paenibacillus durus]|uniref:S-layer homology domain-containing protein n=1 Tax=Paenibacillus durus TaxID=44251 RepID=UPI0006940385|nr:S-layer homology domain-containing protein [Paenibacillus durus]